LQEKHNALENKFCSSLSPSKHFVFLHTRSQAAQTSETKKDKYKNIQAAQELSADLGEKFLKAEMFCNK